MFRKFLIFAIFLAIYGTKSLTYGETVKCDFENEWFDKSVSNMNVTYYTCNLDSSNLNYNSNVTNIEGNHLTGMGDGDVKRLRIYINHLLKTFSTIFCQIFPNLEIIYMNEALIETIDENALRNCRNLKYLDLKGNNLRELPEYLLITNAKLRDIEISNSNLASLPEDFFSNQKEVEVLDVAENKFKAINPKLFENLDSLRFLALHKNEITEIPSKALKSATKLKKLYLYSNKIQTLHPDSFEGLNNLKQLSLYENQISNLPENVFRPLEKLNELYLNDNLLTTLHGDSFGSLLNLKEIYLQNNKINAIDEKIIDKTALEVVVMENNVCSIADILYRNFIKPKLQKCFDNYKPRQQPTTASIHQTTEANSCGKLVKAQGNVINGATIQRGSFPWLAALVLSNGSYFCGGALISKRKVLTAAHCIRQKDKGDFLTKNDFVVLLGSYDLNKIIEVDRQTVSVEKINIHHDWDIFSQSFDADIAVLILASDAIYGPFIQPICMIPPNSPIATITDGVVAGYGRSEDETKIHENIPKMLNMPIQESISCFLRNHLLVPLSSKRTFCAGDGKGQGVCSGDSGGGLVVEYEGTYFLRGLVSSSLFTIYTCDVNTYSIFTNVLDYSDWINEQSGNPFLNVG